MEHVRKIAKISSVLAFVAIAFFAGFFIGFNRQPEVDRVAGLDNKDVPDDISNADFNDFWKAWNLLNEKHPEGKNISSQEKVWGAIKGLTDSIGDPYTYFFNPEEAEDLNIDLSGEFYGVGMEVGVKDGNLIVISPLKDSPAERAGILAGDLVIKIGEEIANTLTVDEAVKLIRGDDGTFVNLTIIREGNESPLEFKVPREKIKVPIVETKNREDGVFVISLFDFSRDSESDFQKALQEFAESKRKYLIVDLRGNPGGYLGSAINISSWFLKEGEPIVIEKSPDPEKNITYRSNGNKLTGTFKVAILVDGGSASASEIVAGALQEHGVAKLIGEQTFGKGSVQELINLSHGSELKITIAQWLTPNGVSISKNGLTPDVVVKFDPEAFKEKGYDNQLEEAAKILLSDK